MNLHAFLDGDVMIVVPTESRLDAAASVTFKDAMSRLSATAPRRVILDMSPIDFMDSSGLGAVIGAMKIFAPETRLEIAALTPAVEKVFELTQMHRFFVIHAEAPAASQDPADALRAV